MKYTINVVTRLNDNGDGGFTHYAYNNEEELLSNHPKSVKFDSKLKEFVKVDLTEEQKKDILNEDDPHENGYIGSDSIEIEIVDGVAKLSKPLSFHAGQ